MQAEHEIHAEYRCIGAQMSNLQLVGPNNMFDAAYMYARLGCGGRYRAVLWPFSALHSFGAAQEQYQGDTLGRSLTPCGGHLLRRLNLEYAKLKLLENMLVELQIRPTTRTRSAQTAVSHATCCTCASLNDCLNNSATSVVLLCIGKCCFYLLPSCVEVTSFGHASAGESCSARV